MKIYSKLMVVDDEPDITFTLKMSLEQRGYSVDVYNDPIEALANFKPDYYVLLLLDVKMPKMNGFELYQELAKIDTKAKVCFFTEYEGLYDTLRKQFPNVRMSNFKANKHIRSSEKDRQRIIVKFLTRPIANPQISRGNNSASHYVDLHWLYQFVLVNTLFYSNRPAFLLR